ncbi:MAG: bifunctional diguanylate cyclase/phosphodiesterase [Solirubrobacteraceae bacterium]
MLGLAGAAFLAAEWRSKALEANRESFESTATGLSSTLDSKLRASVELTRTMRAIATMEPNAGQTRFLQWYQQLQRGAPTPPVAGNQQAAEAFRAAAEALNSVVATLIEPVPASGLSAFRRQAEADPAFRALLGGSFQVVPSGNRPVYCLTRAIVGASASTSSYPPLLDYCAPVLPGIGRSPFAPLIRTATDTGSFVVTPLPEVSGSLAAIAVAVYRRAASLATVGARRAALTGVIGTSFDSEALIRSLLVGHQSLTLALYHKNVGGPLQLIGRAGANPGGRSPGYSERSDLGEGWLAEVTGRTDRPVSDAQGLFVLGCALLITVLIFLLHLALSRSRQRAWSLVGKKTGELEYVALHDPLTDLPNRALVLDRAEQILARARRLNVPVTALFMDIDGFKQINDRFGHQAGDDVLRQIGARLKTIVRDSDTVGRLGGDEFMMLVDSAGLDVAPELIAERILALLRQPMELRQPAHSLVSLTVSIGIATGLPASAEDLLQDADVALHKAKAAGKDCYVLSESAMQTAARDHIHLEMDLTDALDADQLFLVYQPILELENEQLVGVEALLRWRHPTRGVIAPDVFIPIAEESGLIIPIGRWVLEQACVQGAAWHQKGYALNIAVNVSARQLERTEFVEEVRTALHDSGLDPAALTLEITETVLMRNPDATADLLTKLNALGVRIAVDDFGTGYSSLAYLRQFPVDSLKIDRTFIADLVGSSEADALAHTLIQLGKALGLQTLAEGVEHRSQVRWLLREGCDLAQGFLFARPLTLDEVERFLHGQRGRAEACVGPRTAPRMTPLLKQ